MTFPHYFHLFGTTIHPHLLMEIIGYTGGFRLYLFLRRRQTRSAIPLENNLWIIVGCIFGALIGSKVLAWIESAPDYWQHRDHWQVWLEGKTIVGGLLGGWAGVELVKRILHITRSTGDLFVYPVIFGQCFGRVGCFLTGLSDHTYGNFTRLPWGVNFGDGPRHPTQLYEILFLLLLAGSIWIFERTCGPQRGGVRFRVYLMSYLLFRFAIEFIKPVFTPYAGLSAIQVASFCGAMICAWQLLSGRGLDEPAPQPMSTGWIMTNTRSQDWDTPLRPEAWAGEIRVNLIRLAAVVLFYGRHLVEWFLAAPDAPIRGRYHLAVTGVVLLWTVLALLLHGWLSRKYFEPWMKYLAIAVDGLMITLLCILAGGPRTPLVLVYFGLIASSPLRLSIRAVYFATAVAMIGYLVLLGHYAWYQIGFRRYYATPELRIPRSEEIITLLAMLVCGLFAGQIVRQIRRIAATQMSSADSGDYPSTVAEKGQGQP